MGPFLPVVNPKSQIQDRRPVVALLTGGGDRPYVFGLVGALVSREVPVDLIGSDELEFPEFRGKRGVNFLNLRGSHRADARFGQKVVRVLRYYARLVGYAATAKPRIFHILWNNKFETFDRTLLMLYYRLLRRRIVLTVHNVNAGKRDSKDSCINRFTLRFQYRLADHLFVHTEKMKSELQCEFGVRPACVTVIPFGINNSIPETCLTPAEAKERLGIRSGEKVILFFGNITLYKGLEYLISAFNQVVAQRDDYRLIIAGRSSECGAYWSTIREATHRHVESGRLLLRAEYIPDADIEIYFKAADVLVLPYRHVYESGVLFLGYNWGLPVLAADVGSLKDEIVEGKTGFVFKPEDPEDLARVLERYFASDLYANLCSRRLEIRNLMAQRHSWEVVSEVTMKVYAGLARKVVNRGKIGGEGREAGKLSAVAERENYS